MVEQPCDKCGSLVYYPSAMEEADKLIMQGVEPFEAYRQVIEQKAPTLSQEVIENLAAYCEGRRMEHHSRVVSHRMSVYA